MAVQRVERIRRLRVDAGRAKRGECAAHVNVGRDDDGALRVQGAEDWRHEHRLVARLGRSGLEHDAVLRNAETHESIAHRDCVRFDIESVGTTAAADDPGCVEQPKQVRSLENAGGALLIELGQALMPPVHVERACGEQHDRGGSACGICGRERPQSGNERST